ncbi:ethanolamine ammonia-lyase [Echinicola strongylocentroti]|uniref:Ethanolamine ammonia-lyase n=1 Tax=Echinicola strongylocentroti TaxID=1795355 RepID=A0A2Z4IKE0_9BACT|nr:ethanolamine ammonia-lyase subunit EutB [Echinicola strongylocentroti]AWW30833.1 ethanolamine ammonia-lyase [Echinicola strongylocentroti]
MTRNEFLKKSGVLGASMVLLSSYGWKYADPLAPAKPVKVSLPKKGEDLMGYITRKKGKFDIDLYRQLIGAANAFKEGDATMGIAAKDDKSRQHARTLLGNTTIQDINNQLVFRDELYDLILETTDQRMRTELESWRMGELRDFLLTEDEMAIKKVMPGLTSDVIGCVVKLMSNEELIQVSQKLFNPLSGSKIGSKGYLSARIQPNSPTDNPEDIAWQVFDAWSYGVGDLVLGTNPVSSEVGSVGKIEATLYDILVTFGLEETMPNCVLSHIDVQAAVEEQQPGTTGIWFQSLAGTVSANRTFDVTLDKMKGYMSERQGQYGLYAETGQGADFTNGHGEGFDMVLHESRKYGFVSALKAQLEAEKSSGGAPWVHVNDVAGFIGPEVFKTKEQLVRCCLEDTLMGKLHGLCIGLDICSTLHMDVDLEDLNWCIDEVMPANPAYLMALPTKNDPMLSYLTTSFSDHVRVREKFGYKVNDAMWRFFKRIGVIGEDNQPTIHFGDPTWVYYQYCLAKGDLRSREEIFADGKNKIRAIRQRGVPIAEGYGDEIWELEPQLARQVQQLYDDAKVSLWTEMSSTFVQEIPLALPIITQSSDRKDYVYHPETGEKLSMEAERTLRELSASWHDEIPDVQIVVSDGLNVRALMDRGHLDEFLKAIGPALAGEGYRVADKPIVIQHGRVRAGYACGELLFGNKGVQESCKGILHIIGERPGSGHHNFSVYLTAANPTVWAQKGTVDHNISRVISGISDTSLKPEMAARQTTQILGQLFKKYA